MRTGTSGHIFRSPPKIEDSEPSFRFFPATSTATVIEDKFATLALTLYGGQSLYHRRMAVTVRSALPYFSLTSLAFPVTTDHFVVQVEQSGVRVCLLCVQTIKLGELDLDKVGMLRGSH